MRYGYCYTAISNAFVVASLPQAGKVRAPQADKLESTNIFIVIVYYFNDCFIIFILLLLLLLLALLVALLLLSVVCNVFLPQDGEMFVSFLRIATSADSQWCCGKGRASDCAPRAFQHMSSQQPQGRIVQHLVTSSLLQARALTARLLDSMHDLWQALDRA